MFLKVFFFISLSFLVELLSFSDKMENNTMYSCGSLAPKMKAKKEQKQSCGGGCSASITFARDSDYWERVDGAIFIISSLVKSFVNQKATLTNIGTVSLIFYTVHHFQPNYSTSLPIHLCETSSSKSITYYMRRHQNR